MGQLKVILLIVTVVTITGISDVRVQKKWAHMNIIHACRAK